MVRDVERRQVVDARVDVRLQKVGHRALLRR